MARHWIAIDFDFTAWDTTNQRPMPGFADALEQFRSLGYRVMIHSCNSPVFIAKCLEQHGLTVDGIWGNMTDDYPHKPIASVYIDDLALHFDGDWNHTAKEALRRLEPKHGSGRQL